MGLGAEMLELAPELLGPGVSDVGTRWWTEFTCLVRSPGRLKVQMHPGLVHLCCAMRRKISLRQWCAKMAEEIGLTNFFCKSNSNHDHVQTHSSRITLWLLACLHVAKR